jgi:hypothetical protein
LPEILARVRHDAVLSGAARRASRRRAVLAFALLRRVLPAGARGYGVAALAAMMAGILVNALTLQHARHPSPFFAVSPPMRPMAVKNSPEPASSLPEPPATAPPPPPRPAGLGAANESVPLPRTADPIADIIRAGGNKDSQRLIATAQNALVKLGYPIKRGADTAAALRDFEKAHDLPISTEVTPRLVKLLNAAATSSASR